MMKSTAMALWDSQQMFKMRLGIANVKVYQYVIEESILIDYQWILAVLYGISKENMLMPWGYLQNHPWPFLVFLCSNTDFLWKHDKVILEGTGTVHSKKIPLSLTPHVTQLLWLSSVELKRRNFEEFTGIYLFIPLCYTEWELELWCFKKVGQ